MSGALDWQKAQWAMGVEIRNRLIKITEGLRTTPPSADACFAIATLLMVIRDGRAAKNRERPELSQSLGYADKLQKFTQVDKDWRRLQRSLKAAVGAADNDLVEIVSAAERQMEASVRFLDPGPVDTLRFAATKIAEIWQADVCHIAELSPQSRGKPPKSPKVEGVLCRGIVELLGLIDLAASPALVTEVLRGRRHQN